MGEGGEEGKGREGRRASLESLLSAQDDQNPFFIHPLPALARLFHHRRFHLGSINQSAFQIV
jgi:hypothetical protein